MLAGVRMPNRMKFYVGLACLLANVCQAGNPQSGKPLFARSADEIFSGQCLELARAAADGNLKRMTALLGDKELVNCRGYADTTPLYWAIAERRGSVEGAKRLLESGADPDQQLEDGDGMLHIAVLRGEARFVQLLLDHGANPNLAGRGGWTPLFSLQNESAEIVRMLLRAGANPDYQSSFGETPMMYLAATSQYGVVLVLLESGADWQLKDKSGHSLLNVMEIGSANWDTQSPEYSNYLKVREFLRNAAR
jgi:ankyrin repeat protein